MLNKCSYKYINSFTRQFMTDFMERVVGGGGGGRNYSSSGDGSFPYLISSLLQRNFSSAFFYFIFYNYWFSLNRICFANEKKLFLFINILLLSCCCCCFSFLFFFFFFSLLFLQLHSLVIIGNVWCWRTFIRIASFKEGETTLKTEVTRTWRVTEAAASFTHCSVVDEHNWWCSCW